MTIPDSATGYVVGIITTVAGGILAWRRLDRSASPLLYTGLMLFMLDFSSGLRAVQRVGLHLQLTGILAASVRATFLIFGSLSGTCARGPASSTSPSRASS